MEWKIKNPQMDLFGKVRAAGWESVLEVAARVLIIWTILEKLYYHRRLLSRAARLIFRGAIWTAMRSVGGSLAFLGAFILFMTPLAAWIFVQASAENPASLVQYSIAALIAAALYALGGLLLFGTGLWLLSPSSRVGRFGKNLVLTHVLRRKLPSRKGAEDFTSKSSFGPLVVSAGV